ncbi:MAG: phage baseplate assembly protein V [Paracoccus sp. (in: a-proteobacteria)]|nr:phage baseplate assembly protein V [Paracoccus sp. (in: a-proteobacteria)]
MSRSFDNTELNRRAANVIQIGVIETADYARGTARVRIGPLLTGDLVMIAPRAGQDRAWWPYEPGEQVCVFAPSGNLSAGVIMGAVYSGSAPAPGNKAGLHRQVYADGTVIEFDRTSSHFRMHLGAGSAEIVAPGGISITGDVTVAGDLIADGISLKAHVHGGVISGGSNTGGPR